ncbi:MAG TPA: hypothetical protein VEY67_06790 [Candidatus Dormibacteraeota bacterium]|nr:hypothetical protein [Candidatus Dormibacteraeota bacterium]
MADRFGTFIAGTIDGLVRLVVIPVTSIIPRLVSSGLLLALFALMWLGFAVALIADQAALDSVARSIGQLPLPILALAWLLFLPVMAGLWIWGTDWPFVLRLVLIAGVAGWNLLVFLPKRDAATPDAPVLSEAATDATSPAGHAA